jgi:hypothetical protein
MMRSLCMLHEWRLLQPPRARIDDVLLPAPAPHLGSQFHEVLLPAMLHQPYGMCMAQQRLCRCCWIEWLLVMLHTGSWFCNLPHADWLGG